VKRILELIFHHSEKLSKPRLNRRPPTLIAGGRLLYFYFLFFGQTFTGTEYTVENNAP
jgi:hypothetical protein